MLQTFASQAAIAVDNARLLREIEQRNNELAESLELQTATSEILELISAHPGDLDTVLNGIVRKASDLCDAPTVSIMLREGDIMRTAAMLDERGRPREARALNQALAKGSRGTSLLPVGGRQEAALRE